MANRGTSNRQIRKTSAYDPPRLSPVPCPLLQRRSSVTCVPRLPPLRIPCDNAEEVCMKEILAFRTTCKQLPSVTTMNDCVELYYDFLSSASVDANILESVFSAYRLVFSYVYTKWFVESAVCCN